MIEVNESLTRRVADLARLELTPTEVTTFTGQLAEILAYVGQLQEVDVTAVDPLVHPIPLTTLLRDDRVVEPLRDAEGRSSMLAPAPEVVQDGFKVPPIL